MSVSQGPNICIVGCGHWGKNLARNFDKLGHLYAVCESDSARLEVFCKQYGVKGFLTLDEALACPQLHAVAIATPAEQHAAMTMAALRAGKDVFVEKPLALRWQDGVEMTSEAHRLDKILMVGHLLLYHPAVLKIKELIDLGELTPIGSVWARSGGKRMRCGASRLTISASF